MKEIINLAFQSGADVLEFGQRPKNRILSIEGYESPDIEHNIIENSLMSGGTLLSTRYPTRLLKHVFEIYGKDQEERRDRALRFFNPNTEILITINRFGRSRKIWGRVSFVHALQSTLFDPIHLTLHVTCEDPLFFEPAHDVVFLSRTVPLFAFPASFPPGGVCASYRAQSSEKVVMNDGEEETGLTVTTQLQVSTRNLWLKNETTGDLMTISSREPMQAGDILTISSERGAAGVWLNGVDFSGETDLASVPVRLQPGENRLAYNIDNGAELAEVSLTFHKRYRSA